MFRPKLERAQERVEGEGDDDETDEREEDDVMPAQHVAAAGAALETEPLQRSRAVGTLGRHLWKRGRGFRSENATTLRT